MDRKLGGLILLLLVCASANAQQRKQGDFPLIHNSADTTCNGDMQCTAAEFQLAVLSEKQRWAVTPPVIRNLCWESQTLPVLSQCVISASLQWLNQHPGARAAWLE